MSTIIGYLIGQVGQLSGARFAIPECGLIIGRDPNHAGLVVEDAKGWDKVNSECKLLGQASFLMDILNRSHWRYSGDEKLSTV